MVTAFLQKIRYSEQTQVTLRTSKWLIGGTGTGTLQSQTKKEALVQWRRTKIQ
jgi:hypothetical protein